LGHLQTQPATNLNPKLRKQLKISLIKKFAPSLLLLHSFQKYRTNQPAIYQIRLQFHYLVSADKCSFAELSGKKGKQARNCALFKSFLHNLYAIRTNQK